MWNLVQQLMFTAAMVAAVGDPAFARAPNLLDCATFPMLIDRFDTMHINKAPRDDARLQAAAEGFLKSHDSTKALFLQSEADLIISSVKGLLSGKQDSCKALGVIGKMRRDAQASIETYVKNTAMEYGLKIDRSIEIQLDTDKRARPKTNAERDALRRKLVHFQLARYVRGGKTLMEAREKLVKRYELFSKRVTEWENADFLDDVVDAYAAVLDPHSTYFSVEQLEDFRINMRLSLEGIGAVLRQDDGFTIVQEIVKGGAADRQGKLKNKDRIIAVGQGRNGETTDVVDMALSDVVRLIRGEKGTEVKLVVLREKKNKKKKTQRTIVIKREKIDLKQQAAKLRVEEVDRGGKKLKLGVLHLPSFYGGRGGRTSGGDMAKLLREARDKKLDGIMLDLATNSGGLLQQAVDIVGLFIKQGPVVRVEGVGGNKNLRDVDPRIEWSGPLVVLTSRLSASASEIVAGAVKDYSRGVLVGDDHTFGKGTVQNVRDMPAGFGAVKVTTARFFRPAGQSTQLVGVETDVVVPSVFGTDKVGEKGRDHALATATTKPFHGKNVNSKDGFTPLLPTTIEHLKQQSAARIAKDKDMQEIIEEQKKNNDDSDIVVLSELLDEKTDDKDDDEEDPDAEEELTPRAKEALQVLADLVATQRK